MIPERLKSWKWLRMKYKNELERLVLMLSIAYLENLVPDPLETILNEEFHLCIFGNLIGVYRSIEQHRAHFKVIGPITLEKLVEFSVHKYQAMQAINDHNNNMGRPFDQRAIA